MLCVMLDGQVATPWLSRIVAPLCLLPALCLAGYLAQHVDKTKKAAFLIGAPTITSMAAIAAFPFFMFSAPGERQLKSPSFAALALLSLGLGIAFCYGVAIWRASLRQGNPHIE